MSTLESYSKEEQESKERLTVDGVSDTDSCTQSGKRSPKSGSSLERQKAIKREYQKRRVQLFREQGRCKSCGKPQLGPKGGAKCSECNKKELKAKRSRYAEKGRCINCGRVRVDLEEGCVACVSCRTEKQIWRLFK